MNQQKKLLIVDDSRMSRMLISTVVSNLRPQWQLYEATSGEEALNVIDEIQPHYVSMDVNMAGMSGLEAAGRIRLRYPEIRIALCTANIQDGVQENAKKSGLLFIRKPVTEASITQMVTGLEI